MTLNDKAFKTAIRRNSINYKKTQKDHSMNSGKKIHEQNDTLTKET